MIAAIAQQVEQLPCKHQVPRSIRGGGTINRTVSQLVRAHH